MTLKRALEECKSQLPVKENVKTDAALRDRPAKEQRQLQYNVTYVGKLAVSHRKAPSTLIDTSVERFRHHNQQMLLTSKLNSLKTEQNDSEAQNETQNEAPSEERHPTRSPVKAMSMDIEDKTPQTEHVGDVLRPRSVSDGTPSSMDPTTREASVAFKRLPKSNRKLSLCSESRSLLMDISVHSVSFSSSVSGKLLMERKVQEISFCQQVYYVNVYITSSVSHGFASMVIYPWNQIRLICRLDGFLSTFLSGYYIIQSSCSIQMYALTLEYNDVNFNYLPYSNFYSRAQLNQSILVLFVKILRVHITIVMCSERSRSLRLV